MKLSELLKHVSYLRIIGSGEPLIEHIELNSMLIRKGGLFVAIKGLKTDGHQYIKSAIENGAVAIVCEKVPLEHNEKAVFIQVEDSRSTLAYLAKAFYKNADEKLIKIAVTGTNGKTSTVYFIRQLLKLIGHKCGLIGTIEYDNGNEQIPALHTTPEVHVIQELFSQMNRNDCQFCVMEVSSHGLALNRLDLITFQLAVFTNLSQDHLDFHRNIDDYFKAKELLFKSHLDGLAILNYDDDFVRRIEFQPQFSFSLSSESDLKIENFKLNASRTAFTIVYNKFSYDFETSVLGHYNLYNLLASIAVLINLKIDIKQIQSAVAQLKPVPGRMETISFKQSLAIIDYAHTPDALLNVLRTSRDFCLGQLICVFGCGGDRDKSKRPQMAKAAEQIADIIIVTSDNPRNEDPESIISDILTGFKTAKNIHQNTDRKQAITTALEMAKTNDIVVIAGKGHEPYQEINGVRYHLDDREIVYDWEKNHVVD